MTHPVKKFEIICNVFFNVFLLSFQAQLMQNQEMYQQRLLQHQQQQQQQQQREQQARLELAKSQVVSEVIELD